MAGKVITIAQQKGGSGKTTLTAQLAVGLMCARARVAVIDLDPQASLSIWQAKRTATLEEANELTHLQMPGWRLGREIDRLKREGFDFILIDSHPHNPAEFVASIRMADLALIPIQPSPMDVWASGPVFQVARAEGTPTLVVLNRVNHRAAIFDQISDMLHQMKVECAQTTLGNRVAFATSMLRGLGVCETESASSSVAVQEIFDLVREVKKHKAIKDQKKAA